MTEEIPGPRAYPLIGNMLDVEGQYDFGALERLFDIHGPIIKLVMGGGVEKVYVGNFDLFDELCDETRFFKEPSLAFSGTPNPGLFTVPSEKDEAWGSAHRALMPAFGPMAIEAMFGEMHDMATQMVLKWARQGPEHRIPAAESFTKLTLDTIGLCAMGFRFNSFYSDAEHPFVQAMNNMLLDGSIGTKLEGRLRRKFQSSYTEQLRKDVMYMRGLSRDLIEERRRNPTEKMDLLNAMVFGKDPKTGQPMIDDLIISNMTTFLVAGHETTSGLLAFAFMYMIQNPATFFKAQKEVDRVVGNGRIKVTHLRDLKYINAVLRETLRLAPTAPAFTRGVRPENKDEKVTIGGGKYEIKRGQGFMCVLARIHRDPKVWGDDADAFNPERMLDGKFEKLPKNAWKPFGTGMRGCIGRPFAWQEALLAIAMVLQNFDVKMSDPDYKLQLAHNLSMKPKDLYIQASLRPGISAVTLQQRLVAPASDENAGVLAAQPSSPAVEASEAADMTILYGSNTGTCQTLAQGLASQAAQKGLKPYVNDLDAAIGKLPKAHPVIVITASYEGQPPDNAARFVAWLESLGEGTKSLDGVQYAVFGCGHTDWASTYQRIPTLVDDLITKAGGERKLRRGFADVSKGDITSAFDRWADGLWSSMSSCIKSTAAEVSNEVARTPLIEIDVSAGERATYLQQHVQWAKVVDTKALTASGQKRHIEFELPENMPYTSGDYLAVLPLNPEEMVKKVTSHFDLPWDGVVTIKKSGSTTLPVGKPITVFDLLHGYVELSQPATKKDVEFLASRAAKRCEREKLQSLIASDDAFKLKILDQRITILDLLARHAHTAASVAFAEFLALLPALRPRYYSISSSPLAEQEHNRCTLTYSVMDAPSWSSLAPTSDGRFLGVASTYLRSLKAGDRALVAVRNLNRFFRPPADPESTPIVMICAGSGLAPFRGFVQERVVMMRQGGRTLAPALLFVGCRDPDTDRLYGEELDAWARLGAVDVRYAFSRAPAASLGCRYVQDRLLHDASDVLDAWDDGALFYVCGGRDMAGGVSEAAGAMLRARARDKGLEFGEAEVDEFTGRMRNKRFLMEVFD